MGRRKDFGRGIFVCLGRVGVSGVFYFNGEDATGKECTEEDSTSSRKPFPFMSENPHESPQGEDEDSCGNESTGERCHLRGLLSLFPTLVARRGSHSFTYTTGVWDIVSF